MNDLNFCYFYPQGTIFTRDKIIHCEQRYSSGCGEYCRFLSPGSCTVDRELLSAQILQVSEVRKRHKLCDFMVFAGIWSSTRRHKTLLLQRFDRPTLQSEQKQRDSCRSVLGTFFCIISIQIIKVIYFKGDMLQNVLEQQFPSSIHCGVHQGLCDY